MVLSFNREEAVGKMMQGWDVIPLSPTGVGPSGYRVVPHPEEQAARPATQEPEPNARAFPASARVAQRETSLDQARRSLDAAMRALDLAHTQNADLKQQLAELNEELERLREGEEPTARKIGPEEIAAVGIAHLEIGSRVSRLREELGLTYVPATILEALVHFGPTGAPWKALYRRAYGKERASDKAFGQFSKGVSVLRKQLGGECAVHYKRGDKVYWLSLSTYKRAKEAAYGYVNTAVERNDEDLGELAKDFKRVGDKKGATRPFKLGQEGAS